MEVKWEVIDNYRQRTRVPGGWLYEVREDVIHESDQRGMYSGHDFRVSCCFIPDPEEQWVI